MIMGFREASRMFRDVWSLYKGYAAKRLTGTELGEFMDKVSGVYEKYKTPFVKEILLAVVNEIERAAKFYDKQKKRNEVMGKNREEQARLEGMAQALRIAKEKRD